jgi:hypothetical protein
MSRSFETWIVSMTEGATFLFSYENLLRSAGLEPVELPKVVEIEREAFVTLIKKLLLAVDIDEDWYRKQNPDVDAAIATGTYRSGKHHFVEEGYFEGRRGGPVKVDEEWYKKTYPDVAEGIDLGEIASAQEHFDEFGFHEGRLPAPL